MNRAFVVCVCAVLLCAPAWAQVVYQVDDGTIENGLGLTAGGDIWWANAFTAVAGGESIEEIRIAFNSNSVNAGQAFSVHVYEDSDDDGDPTTGTLTLLASANATVADASGETFQSIAVGPATISGGFFVAAVMTHTSGQYPAAMDETSSQGQSWIGGASTGAMDPGDPIGTSSAVAVQLADSLGFPCNWALRAVSGGAAGADLAVTKTADATGTVYPGDQITYTIDVVNNGPSDATGVTVTDNLPATVAYVSDTCGGTHTAGTWTWAIGGLANTASVSCDVVVEVVAGANGPIDNTATVAGTETDPTPANDASTASVTASNQIPGIPALGTTGAGLLILLLGSCAVLILRRRLS